MKANSKGRGFAADKKFGRVVSRPFFVKRPVFGRSEPPFTSANQARDGDHMQKRCLPMVVIYGRDQIQELVAVAGLK